MGEAEDGEAAVRETQLTQPDVVLMDVRMPGIDGVEATRRIRRAVPDTAVLVLTMYEDDATVFTAMQAGAQGYLLKGAGRAEILRSVREVAEGEAIFGPSIALRLAAFFATPPATPSEPPFPELTAREREVLELVARHRTNPQIADALGVSGKRVKLIRT